MLDVCGDLVYASAVILSIPYIVNSFMTEVLSYRNQSINSLCKSVEWFLYDRDLRHERVKDLKDSVNAVTANSSDICFLGIEMWKIIKGVFSGK